MQILRKLARAVVDGIMLKRLHGPFARLKGNAWVAPLPGLVDIADCESAPRRSTLAIYEDHVPFRSPHSPLEEIQDVGLGRYVHRDDRLVFSTSDNTDPNVNGRSYQISSAPWLFNRRADRPELDRSKPINYRTRDTSAAKIRTDVEYALRSGQVYRDMFRKHLGSIEGKSLLELGPGHNYGCAMTLAAYGVRPMVLDRFLSPWEEPYHSLYYAGLRNALAGDPTADVGPIDALLRARDYPESVVVRRESPVESAPFANDSIDMVLSNAVVEHLFDPEKAFVELFRITRPGGVGVHQVDCRDHRNFNRPLEYLLLDNQAFWRMFEGCFSECGAHFRPKEYRERMQRAGFTMLSYEEMPTIEPAYLADILPRLRQAKESPYCAIAETELIGLGCLCQIRKPSA